MPPVRLWRIYALHPALAENRSALSLCNASHFSGKPDHNAFKGCPESSNCYRGASRRIRPGGSCHQAFVFMRRRGVRFFMRPEDGAFRMTFSLVM